MNRNFKVLLGVLVGVTVISLISNLNFKSWVPAPEVTTVTKNSSIVVEPKKETIDDIKIQKKTIYNLTLDPSRTLFLNTEVDTESVDLIIEKIETLNQINHYPIVLLLDSPGGNVFDGLRLISFVEASPSPIYTVVVGTCASMCANIEEHGTQRLSLSSGILMFHPAAGGVSGPVPEMQSLLNFIDHVTNKLDAYIADRSGIPRDVFKSQLRSQLWIQADDALDMHLVDKLVTLSTEPTNNSKIFNLKLLLKKPQEIDKSTFQLLKSFK